MGVYAKDLAKIAEAMKAEIAEKPDQNGQAERLIGAYHVLLLARNGGLKLHVGLKAGWPLLEDVQTFAEGFGVPIEDREARPGTQWLDSRIGGPKLKLQTLCFSWREQLVAAHMVGRQVTLFGPAEIGRDALGGGL